MATAVAGPITVPIRTDLSDLAPAAAQVEKSLGGIGGAADRTRSALEQNRAALRRNEQAFVRLYALLQSDPTDASRERILRLGDALGRQRSELVQTARALQQTTTATQSAAQATTQVASGVNDYTQAAGRATLALRENAQALQRVQALYASDPTDASRARLERLTGALLAQRSALRQQAGGLDRVGRSGGAASQVLTDLGRATNDSIQFQYGLQQGLIATANQLEGLALGFGRMKAQAASAGTTIQTQLIGALKGPGGLVLLLNVAATAAVLFGDKIVGAMNDAGRSAANAREETNKLIDSLIRADLGKRGFTFGTVSEGEDLLSRQLSQLESVRRQLANVRATVGTRQINVPSPLGGTPSTQQVADPTGAQSAAIQTLTDEIGILNAGVARTRDQIADLRREGNLADLLQLPDADPFQPVTRSAGSASGAVRAVAADFAAFGDEGETAAERIRRALDEAARGRSELIDAGEITRLDAARQSADDLRRALEQAGSIDPSDEERSGLIRDLRGDLAEARVQATLLAVRMGAIALPRGTVADADALGASLGAAADAVRDLPPEYERASGAALELSAAQKIVADNAEIARASVRALSDSLADAAIDLGALAVLGDRGFQTELSLAEIDASDEIERLREAGLSAEELALRIESVNQRLADLRAQAPTVANILKGAFREVTAEIARTIIKALALRAVLAGLNFVVPGAGSFLGFASGVARGVTGAGEAPAVALKGAPAAQAGLSPLAQSVTPVLPPSRPAPALSLAAPRPAVARTARGAPSLSLTTGAPSFSVGRGGDIMIRLPGQVTLQSVGAAREDAAASGAFKP